MDAVAAERRARRKQKILENAEHRINAILKGPEGSEDRQAPVIDGEPTSPISLIESQRSISFEDDKAEEKNRTATHEFLIPLEFINQRRLYISVTAGLILRLLVEFGILRNVVWPWVLACATYEICVFQQKKLRFPKHKYAINFLLCNGIKEENVIFIGLMLDILTEILYDSIIALLSFLTLHGSILIGKYLLNLI